MIKADLDRADFEKADLSGADLLRADRTGSKIADAILCRADLSATIFTDVEGLVQERLDRARGYPQTSLPDHSVRTSSPSLAQTW
jgi:uncharacterized protein YjbI with pentapeptide repeats